MWQGDYPFLGYQVYSLGNQETGRYESGGNTILPNLIGGCEDGFEIDPQTQTCVATKFTPPSSKENTQGMTLGCTDSNSSNFKFCLFFLLRPDLGAQKRLRKKPDFFYLGGGLDVWSDNS